MNIQEEIAAWPAPPPNRAHSMEIVQCALADTNQRLIRTRAQLATWLRYAQKSLDECGDKACHDCNEVRQLIEATK